MTNVVGREAVEGALQWRYATKSFDPSKKISASDWAALEQSLLLAPSSFGLQPWHFVVVSDPAVRKQIRSVAWDQSQVEDASHLVVLAARQNVGVVEVDRLIKRISEVRGVAPETLAEYRQMMLGFVEQPKPGFNASEWAARQTYIALGFLLSTAASMGIDACPMEGFIPPKVDQILGLGAKGYSSVVMATLGYRASDDHYAKAKKVRFSKNEVITVR